MTWKIPQVEHCKKTKVWVANKENVAVSADMEEETPKPTIELDSPRVSSRERYKEFEKLFPKYDKKDYGKMYYTMNKFRKRQMVLLDSEDIEDPDPFQPLYIFFCFTGMRWKTR